MESLVIQYRLTSNTNRFKTECGSPVLPFGLRGQSNRFTTTHEAHLAMPALTTSATEGALPVQPARHQTGLITIVFTDLVASTALKQHVGDRAGASLIQRHHG